MNTLTISDVDKGEEDARWGGWGYLGERRRHANCGEGCDSDGRTCWMMRELGDELLLEFANKENWTYDDLFVNFLDAVVGRHYGDLIFGGYDEEAIRGQCGSYFSDARRRKREAS
jgi:hypothetical protein